MGKFKNGSTRRKRKRNRKTAERRAIKKAEVEMVRPRMSGLDIQRRRLVCEALAVELCKRLGITLDSIRAKTKTSKADARINGLRRKVILAMHKLGYTTVDIGFALHRDHKSIHFYIHGRTDRRGSTQERKLGTPGKPNGELGSGAGCSPDGHTGRATEA